MDVTGRGVLFLALSSVVWRATSQPPFAPRREGVTATFRRLAASIKSLLVNVNWLTFEW